MASTTSAPPVASAPASASPPMQQRKLAAYIIRGARFVFDADLNPDSAGECRARDNLDQFDLFWDVSGMGCGECALFRISADNEDLDTTDDETFNRATLNLIDDSWLHNGIQGDLVVVKHDRLGPYELPRRTYDAPIRDINGNEFFLIDHLVRRHWLGQRMNAASDSDDTTFPGVGHLQNRFRDAQRGALAVPCWTCPLDGFNLPEGWESSDPDDQFLYALMLALDANFRLKNRIRKNERSDESLGSGLGYFVENETYKTNLREYVGEEDISTCIAFAALMQKDTRLTKGLRISGVGGCVCARHGVVRAEGLGDLQKGERYANMDYILMHALVDARVKRLVLSYDIACQWKQNLRKRVVKIIDPQGLLPRLDDYDIQFTLPVWHAAAHEVSCQMSHSLSYATGVGRTDGEGIERTWSVLNPMGFSTKEMGDGNRHDTLEDKVDRINFDKNANQGDVLARKLLIAVAERDKQDEEFLEVDKSLSSTLRKEWQTRVDDWLVDKTKPNPYTMDGGPDAGPSEAKVAAELKEAEVAEARAQRGEFVDGKMTGTAFIKGLLQLEDLSRRIRQEAENTNTLTAERAGQIDELRASFYKKLNAIHQQQAVYMAGRGSAGEREPSQPKAEETKLWLPSDLTDKQRWASRRGLFDVEAKLRRAQCGDALVKVRHLLYAKTHLIYQRNANATGQYASTRSSTLIGRVTDKIDREWRKYQQAYQALVRLKGESYAPELKPLTKDDLTVRAETESDAAARTRLGRVGSRPMRNEPARNEPTADEVRPISWIWLAVPTDEKVRVHEAVRVQWAKALARRNRWREEVRLLREEMKRVLRSLHAVQRQWQGRMTARTGVDPALAAGLAAYARRQIRVHRSFAESFCARWADHASPVAKRILSQDAVIYSRIMRGEPEDGGAAVTGPSSSGT
ncbi:hypothetical protein HMN09_00374100 [Mycena chlorophos]|uniref:CxC2-like cysteine cluster KDZ transposase-associated domain-containing protein n=1 Tax=Mycena chlorophos TaxID=658473 RepID=A0A8H6TH54_MYCCL|nr:hypothetical protein HMN09_00374100 [Mycena chlorophos]